MAQTPITRTGVNIILDLGRMGYDLFEKIDDFLSLSDNYNTDLIPYAYVIYETVLGDVIRLLDQEPHEAVLSIKYLPRTDTYEDIILLFEPERFSRLMLVCQEASLLIYLKLVRDVRSRGPQNHIPDIIQTDYVSIDDEVKIQYIPIQIGKDYVVVREVITEQHDTNQTG